MLQTREFPINNNVTLHRRFILRFIFWRHERNSVSVKESRKYSRNGVKTRDGSVGAGRIVRTKICICQKYNRRDVKASGSASLLAS